MASPILTDNFESYSLGNLSNTLTWSSSDNSYQVENSVVHSGSQAVSVATGGFEQIALGDGTAQNSGYQAIYIRCAQTNATLRYNLALLNTTVCARVTFSSAGNIDWYYNGGNETIQTYNADTWYKVATEWSSADNKYRVTIDSGTPTAYQTSTNTIANASRIYIDALGTGTFYFDDLEGAPITYTLSSNQGSYLSAGQNASLSLNVTSSYSISCNQGSYALTGQNVALSWGDLIGIINCNTGYYKMTGEITTLFKSKLVSTKFFGTDY